MRLVTAVSTDEVTHHEIEPEPVPAAQWNALSTPPAMFRAGRELGERHFFTQMLRIADLVQIPAVSDAIASQYSEGCFATWDPDLDALVATITGSARPVDKGRLTADDLAVITGLRADGRGARIRQVEGLRNQSPSSESVEMREMAVALPAITLGPAWGIAGRVPVVRSKLHGHRGISAYDPRYVEYVPLDPPYYHYLVSCATEAQAHGIPRPLAALRHCTIRRSAPGGLYRVARPRHRHRRKVGAGQGTAAGHLGVYGRRLHRRRQPYPPGRTRIPPQRRRALPRPQRPALGPTLPTARVSQEPPRMASSGALFYCESG